MSDLDPKFKVEIQFPFTELFDPSKPLSQWVSNLARASNDLLLAHRRLDETFAGEPLTGHQAIYDIKQVARHVWELIKFLDKSRTDEVEQFVSRLPEQARRNYERAFELLNSLPAPNKRSFRGALSSARNQASHYSHLDNKALKGALTRLGEPNDDGTLSVGKVRIGETQKDFYAEFASVLDYQLFIPTKGEDLKPLKEFAPQLRELAVTLIRFSSETVQAYLYENKDQLDVSDIT